MHTKKSKIWTGLFTLLLVLGIIFPMLGALKQISAAPVEDAKITVSDTATGYTLKAYKLLSAEKSGDNYIYTVNSKYKDILKTALGITGTSSAGLSEEDQILNELGKLTSDGSDYGTLRPVADKIYKALVTANTAPEMTKEETATSTELSPLAGGYYLIGEVFTNPASTDNASKDPVSLAMVKTTVDANTTVTLKRDRIPELEKKIKEIDEDTAATINTQTGSTKWKDAADYKVGTKVPFRLVATLPKDYVAFTKYKLAFFDKLSAGLSYDANTIKVYRVPKTATEDLNTLDSVSAATGATEITSSLYSINTSNASYQPTATSTAVTSNTLSVTFDDLKAKVPTAVAGDKIVVEYTATLTSDAAVYNQVGNPNDAYVEFSRDPNVDADYGKTPEDRVTAFTFKVVVNKVDGAGEDLDGAGFTLYKKTAATSTSDANQGWTAVGAEVKTGHTFNFTGLDAGTYKLVETTVPANYNKAADFTFKVVPTYGAVTTSSTENISALDIKDLNDSTLVASNGNVGTFTVDLGTLTATTKIVNNSGKQLPSTGGMGTVLLYTAGAILAVGAGVYLIVKRRTTVK